MKTDRTVRMSPAMAFRKLIAGEVISQASSIAYYVYIKISLYLSSSIEKEKVDCEVKGVPA